MNPKRIAIATAAVAVMALLPALVTAQQTSRKQVFRSTMPAVTMIIAATLEGEKIKPIGGGSGTIVTDDGRVLTNYHVIGDIKKQTPHDLFVIARFRAADRTPELVCAGRPADGILQPTLDLALVRCSLNLDLKSWTPTNWPSIPLGRSEDIVPGERIWVLGYPNVGGNTIHVTEGLVSGWTGESGGASGRAYMKTDAAIAHGNSGGTAIDERGELVGVPTAFRATTARQGGVIVTAGKVGLIRPIEHARPMLRHQTGIATAADKPTARGVQIASRVVDVATGAAVEGAMVVVFRRGVSASDVSVDELDRQALAWGRSDAGGAFVLGQRIERGQSLTVGVFHRSYEPLVVDKALVLATDAPDRFDPWSVVRLSRK